MNQTVDQKMGRAEVKSSSRFLVAALLPALGLVVWYVLFWTWIRYIQLEWLSMVYLGMQLVIPPGVAFVTNLVMPVLKDNRAAALFVAPALIVYFLEMVMLGNLPLLPQGNGLQTLAFYGLVCLPYKVVTAAVLAYAMIDFGKTAAMKAGNRA